MSSSSSYVFDRGEAIEIGTHGEHDFVFDENTPVNDEGQTTLVFEEGTSLGSGKIVWYAGRDATGVNGSTANGLFELDPSDFSVIRSNTSLGYTIQGAGGDATVIWTVSPGSADNISNSSIYREHTPTDLSLVRSKEFTVTDETLGPTESGGNDTNFYIKTEGFTSDGLPPQEQRQLRERDVNDFSLIRSVDDPENGGGLGGDNARVWEGSRTDGFVRERSPDDFSVVNAVDKGIAWLCFGGGGSVYAGQDDPDTLYELDPTDFSTIKSSGKPSSPYQVPIGVGGE